MLHKRTQTKTKVIRLPLQMPTSPAKVLSNVSVFAREGLRTRALDLKGDWTQWRAAVIRSRSTHPGLYRLFQNESRKGRKKEVLHASASTSGSHAQISQQCMVRLRFRLTKTCGIDVHLRNVHCHTVPSRAVKVARPWPCIERDEMCSSLLNAIRFSTSFSRNWGLLLLLILLLVRTLQWREVRLDSWKALELYTSLQMIGVLLLPLLKVILILILLLTWCCRNPRNFSV